MTLSCFIRQCYSLDRGPFDCVGRSIFPDGGVGGLGDLDGYRIVSTRSSLPAIDLDSSLPSAEEAQSAVRKMEYCIVKVCSFRVLPQL